MKLQKGNFVKMDGLIAVVIATEEDPNVPEGHVALWFGLPTVTRVSEGGSGSEVPIASTVPIEYCNFTNDIDFTH